MASTSPSSCPVSLATRAKFDELTHDLVDATIVPVQNALKDADLDASEIDKVLLVGGSTRIPAVQDEVQKIMGKEPFKGINPDECVAIGASIQGGKLAGDEGAGDILLLDVTPLTLGIETAGGVATPLIPRNTTIPTNKKQVFSTYEDNQTAVDINVVQGERPLARDNKSLGRFRLDGIAPAPRGIPQIEVTFDIDANGITTVTAKDLGTGKEQNIKITSSTNLSDEEIDKAVKEAEQYAEQDKKRKEAVDVKNEADSLIFQTKKLIDELGDKINEADKAKINAQVENLEKVNEGLQAETMSETDVTTLKNACEDLNKTVQEFSTQMYQQAQQAQQQAGAQGGANPGADDVIDN